jgi:hypothetical protein
LLFDCYTFEFIGKACQAVPRSSACRLGKPAMRRRNFSLKNKILGQTQLLMPVIPVFRRWR